MWPGIHDMPPKHENNMLTRKKNRHKALFQISYIFIPELSYYDIQALIHEQTLQVPQMDEHCGP